MNERFDFRKLEHTLTPEVLDASFVAIQDAFRARRDKILAGAGVEKSVKTKEDKSLVTKMDNDIEQEVQGELRRQFPNLPVFGEETGYDHAELQKLNAFWLLDPIDGTSAYIKGEPTFTCMAMCIEKNKENAELEVTRALIYDPTENTMFTAQKDQGAYKTTFDDDGNRVSETRINLGTLAMPATAMCKKALIPQIDRLLASSNVTCFPAPSGGGFRYTQVLEGTIAAGFQLQGGGKIHDYAGGGLLVTEAGGVVIPILDDKNTWDNGVSSVACHPQLAETVREQIPELRALEHARP